MLYNIYTLLFIFSLALRQVSAEPLELGYRDDDKAIIKLNDETITLTTHEGVVWDRGLSGEAIKVAAVLSSPKDFVCFLWTQDTSQGKDFISPTFYLSNPLKREVTADRVYCYTRPRYSRTVFLLENDRQDVDLAFIEYGPIRGSRDVDRAFATVSRAAIVETEIRDGYCQIYHDATDTASDTAPSVRRSPRILPGQPLLETQYYAWGLYCFNYD